MLEAKQRRDVLARVSSGKSPTYDLAAEAVTPSPRSTAGEYDKLRQQYSPGQGRSPRPALDINSLRSSQRYGFSKS